MATIKSYTDLVQSKKLAEILPLESADMVLLHEEPYETSDSMFDGLHQALCVPFTKYDKSWRQKYKNISYFPCWSLASLLGMIQKNTPYKMEHFGDKKVQLTCVLGDKPWELIISDFDNEVDACVEMIIKLHEEGLS